MCGCCEWAPISLVPVVVTERVTRDTGYANNIIFVAFIKCHVADMDVADVKAVSPLASEHTILAKGSLGDFQQRVRKRKLPYPLGIVPSKVFATADQEAKAAGVFYYILSCVHANIQA